jgi:hypothetical protein
MNKKEGEDKIIWHEIEKKRKKEWIIIKLLGKIKKILIRRL